MSRKSDREMVKVILTAFTYLTEFLHCFKMPDDVFKAIWFGTANLKAVIEKDDETYWKDVKLKEYAGLDTLIEMTTKIWWVACKLGLIINKVRHAQGKPLINFEYEAAKMEAERLNDGGT